MPFLYQIIAEALGTLLVISDNEFMRLLLSILILSTLSSWALADDLNSFVKGLDKTLHHLHRNSTQENCPANSLTPKTAQLTTFQGQPATVMSEADAQKLFQELKEHKEIPFDFSLAGCEERAHEMSRLMLLKGVTPLKAFVSVDENKVPRLEIPDPRHEGQRIQWKYHVAPVILVQTKKGPVPYTLDPSMESKPVPVSEWRAAMTRHNPQMETHLNFTSATQFDVDGRIKINFTDQDFNKANQESLQKFKQLSKDPHGEEEYLFELQRNEERMNMMDSPPDY